MSTQKRHLFAATHRLADRAARLARDAATITDIPWPVARMVRGGGSIVAVLLFGLLQGKEAVALIGAIFAYLLTFVDQPTRFDERILVLALAGAVFASAGAIGLSLHGDDAMLVVATFGLALVAGFVHGSLPGLEIIPRHGLICLVAGAHLDLPAGEAAEAAFLALASVLMGVVVDDAIRHGVRGPSLAALRAMTQYPGPIFSAVYGSAAAVGLLIGFSWGGTRPYWVTITTLVVMQPDRKASVRRVVQRLFGTIAGVLVAMALAAILHDPVRLPVLFGLLFTLPFVYPLAFVRNYAVGVAVVSVWVLVLIDLGLPSGEPLMPLFAARTADTALGCAIALVGSIVVSFIRRQDEP